MIYSIKSYDKTNEVLYVLEAVQDKSGDNVSKIALQKLLYLSTALAPIKEVILSFLRFHYQRRGPYSKDIQNVVDHLVALGLVDLADFRQVNDRASYAQYGISQEGRDVVKQLIEYDKEEEKRWWIRTVVNVAIAYVKTEPLLEENSEYSGLDTVVEMVYQDPTFTQVKNHVGRYGYIRFDRQEEEENDETRELIEYIKAFASKNNLEAKSPSQDKSDKNGITKVVEDGGSKKPSELHELKPRDDEDWKRFERKNAEMLLFSLMEYFFVNFKAQNDTQTATA